MMICVPGAAENAVRCSLLRTMVISAATAYAPFISKTNDLWGEGAFNLQEAGHGVFY
jgi:hypothetical protein